MTEKKKNIAILGSTGSIGRQALKIVDNYPGLLQIELLTANDNKDLLISQAIKYKPDTVIIANTDHYVSVNEILFEHGIKVFSGSESINQAVTNNNIDLILNALVGFSGFLPTISAIKANKNIALANKESLVVGGQMIHDLLKKSTSSIIPVDSEHSAIFQCLAGEFDNAVNRIYLTASGGPFYGYSHNQLKKVTKKQALNHPKWNMGDKITIDSATLMNKGFEVIEAHWLFGTDADQIKVLIHPQSIIHSLVEFSDGSIKAQLGIPDMILPIQYAFFYPVRKPTFTKAFDFMSHPEFTFNKPDTKIFRNLALAYDCLETGGNLPCALNAANEISVSAFLDNKISFLEIPGIIEKCLENTELIKNPGMDDYINTDKITRIKAKEYISFSRP